MYFSKLIINNFRSFKGKYEFSFKQGKNFLVGNNNVGKTTIFEAIDFLFNGLKRNQDIEDLVNNKSDSESMYVKIICSDVTNQIIDEKKFSKFISNGSLTLIRGTHIKMIDTKGKSVIANERKLLYLNVETNKYQNPAGINNATKHFIDPTFVYANAHNEDYQNFKSSNLLGKLLQIEAKNVIVSPKFSEIEEAFNKLVSDKDGIQDHLNNVKEYMEDLIGNQFGNVKLNFDFQIPNMDTIIKNGRVSAEDSNGEQDISEKGTGLQRALVLSVIQAYANFAKEAEATQFCIDEPELYMHPTAQDSLLKSLSNLSKNNSQIFLTTHSPYILRHFNSKYDTVTILSTEVKNRVQVMEDLVFYPTSIGEITYKAFGVPTIDLHQRLYTSIEYEVAENEKNNVTSENNFGEYLVENYPNIIKKKKFRQRYLNQVTKSNGWIPKIKEEALPYIVRNEIDHPEVYLDDETNTNNFSEVDLKESINELFKIYKCEMEK